MVACSQVADVCLHSLHLLGKATKSGIYNVVLNSGSLQAAPLVMVIAVVSDPRELLRGLIQLQGLAASSCWVATSCLTISVSISRGWHQVWHLQRCSEQW